MAATPESKVKAKIKAILKKHDIYYAMPIGTGYGNSGVPDFLCCINGHFVAIEAKAGKGQATALQLKNLDAIQTSGGHPMIIREHNYEYLENVIKDCMAWTWTKN
jgi:hypothetical protein